MNKRVAYEVSYWVLIVLLLVFGGFLLFWNLGAENISECDEARHGINAYEMLQSGDYVVSTYRGAPDYWNLKPPLSYYSIILGYQLFGFNAFGMRFYSALSMLLTMIVMALWTKKYYGSIASITCQLFWMACALVYGPHFARYADADAQMLFFYVIAMLCMLESPKNLKWLYGSAVCFGLAFMSKSWHAALIPVTCFVFVCITGLIRKLRLKHYLLLVFFGLLPVLPWAIARYMRDGFTFFQMAFTVDVGARATTVHEGHYGNVWYYVEHLLSDRTVCLTALFCIGGLLWKAFRRTHITTHQIGVVLWFLVPLLLYSACVSKLAWYILVSLPALAIALGWVIAKLSARGRWRAVRLAMVALTCIFLANESWGNLKWMDAAYNGDSYQRILHEYTFDREYDAGTKIYIQYESQNTYAPVDYRVWMQDDLLNAMLLGDLQCMDGGSEAFMEEEDHAYLLCHDIGMNMELMEEFPIVLEDHSLTLFENLN